jgi:hypothetical protein
MRRVAEALHRLRLSSRASFSLLDTIELLDHAPVFASPSHALSTPL